MERRSALNSNGSAGSGSEQFADRETAAERFLGFDDSGCEYWSSANQVYRHGDPGVPRTYPLSGWSRSRDVKDGRILRASRGRPASDDPGF
jgi:hypothetical protein